MNSNTKKGKKEKVSFRVLVENGYATTNDPKNTRNYLRVLNIKEKLFEMYKNRKYYKP